MPEGVPINPEEYAHENGDFSDVHNPEFQEELRAENGEIIEKNSESESSLEEIKSVLKNKLLGLFVKSLGYHLAKDFVFGDRYKPHSERLIAGDITHDYDDILAITAEAGISRQGYSLEQYSNQLEKFFAEHEEALVDIGKEFSGLDNEQLNQQLRLRLDFLHLFQINFSSNDTDANIFDSIKRSKETGFENLNLFKSKGNPRYLNADSNSDPNLQIMKDFYKKFLGIPDIHKSDEPHLVMGALIVAPVTTKEFINSIIEVIESANSTEIVSHTPTGGSNFNNYLEHTRIAMIKNIREGKMNFFAGKKVFEVGGHAATNTLKQLGAETAEPADAGGAGGEYGGGGVKYHEKVLSLKNYREYAEPHSIDFIYSAQLFDYGSGIGYIADTTSPLKRDDLGMEEMTLIMSNLLKQGGIMVHDEMIPSKIARQTGIELVANLRLRMPGFNQVFIYRQSKQAESLSHKMGRKTAKYDLETQTWEI